MYITGTTAKTLTNFIYRLEAILGLEDADSDLTVQKICDTDAGGLTYGNSEHVQIYIAREDTEGRYSRKQLMINIAHEMIHAQQIHTGKLANRVVMCDKSFLGIKNIVEWDGVDHSDTPYKEQPWEIEAYAKQEELYERCK